MQALEFYAVTVPRRDVITRSLADNGAGHDMFTPILMHVHPPI